jgi:predicted lipid-binding transport protein (Tim44 family)
MQTFLKKFMPFFLVFLACLLFEAGISAEFADARSGSGGKSFSRSTPRQSPTTTQAPLSNQTGGMSRGLMGGLMGGALGGLLLGSMLGGGHGSGIGILPILILAGVAFFLYKRFTNRPSGGGSQGGGMSPLSGLGDVFKSPMSNGPMSGSTGPPPPPPPFGSSGSAFQGMTDIQRVDPGFDPQHFTEVASDVFFQVQAGWMRRDLQSYRHLLGDQLAREYEARFAEMRQRGHINKLESIAVRKVEVVDSGSDGKEDFVTVLFTANLLDYTVDDKTGALIEGSMTTPVKFEEEWTWQRPTGTDSWKLEGIKVVNG